jgi:hypothetical protein
MGSVAAVRLAGNHAANKPVRSRSELAKNSVSGSRGAIPNTRLRSDCPFKRNRDPHYEAKRHQHARVAQHF